MSGLTTTQFVMSHMAGESGHLRGASLIRSVLSSLSSPIRGKLTIDPQNIAAILEVLWTVKISLEIVQLAQVIVEELDPKRKVESVMDILKL